ncbi:MAG: 3,4-dihydroxy-2-butanone-4-phosphate synthase, partial [Flavobacteriales bacterium]
LEDIRNGKVVIVVDNENRENEGDFITAAENVTPETINFMAKHGRGLICAPVLEDRCEELGLEMMVTDNTALHETPFTVSIDLKGHGCSTGISASDRAKTVKALVDPNITAGDFGKPGHIFPLKAKKGGVLRRTGHTEATVDLAKLAGFKQAGVLVEIMNEDGSMARLPELKGIAKEFDLKIISIDDLISYRLEKDTLIQKEVEVKLPERFNDFKLIGYKQTTTDDEHLALIKGEWTEEDEVLVRVHSSDLIRNIYTYQHSPQPPQLKEVMNKIDEEGRGAIIFMQQKKNKEGIIQRLKDYKNSRNEDALGFKMDTRDFGVGAQIIRDLNIRKMKLLSNNPKNRTGLVGYGLEVVENVKV